MPSCRFSRQWLCTATKEDRRIWRVGKQSSLSVASCFKTITFDAGSPSLPYQEFGNFFARKGVPSYGRACACLNTMDRVQRRNPHWSSLPMSTPCVYSASERLDHLLLNCQFPTHCWNTFPKGSSVYWVRPKSFSDILILIRWRGCSIPKGKKILWVGSFLWWRGLYGRRGTKWHFKRRI